MENKGPLQIKELKLMNPGQQVFGKYLLLDKVQRKTKDGKDMHNIKLGDATGEIDAVVWENAQISGAFEVGAIVGLLGDTSIFKGNIQLTAKRIKVLDEDPDAYIKGPKQNLKTLQNRWEQIIESITDPYLGELLQRIFNAEEKGKFYSATAAKSVHHNYQGGLLEHTVEVAELCHQAVQIFPGLNRDLLITGALLHDIGKVMELDVKVVAQYTVEGRLLGHIFLGAEIIAAHINEIRKDGGDFPQKLEWMLKHMILSHHGNLEFGSPVIPLFPEAFLLSAMDNLDAKMFVFFNKIDDTRGDNEFFTNYDSFFAQHFFKYRYDGPDNETE